MPDPVGNARMIFGLALRGISEGLSGNKIFTAARDAGIRLRRTDALKIIADARKLVGEYGQEPFRPMGAAPTAAELGRWPTQGAEGVIQTIRLTYRERKTGRIVEQHYSVKSGQGVTRQTAVNAATDAYQAAAERYQQDLIGAVHLGGAQLIPTQVA